MPEDDAAVQRRGRFARLRSPESYLSPDTPFLLSTRHPCFLVLSLSLFFFSSSCTSSNRLLLLALPVRRFFLPDHGIISLKAHGGEGTTKEERLPYEATVYVPPRARVLTPPPVAPFSRGVFLSFSSGGQPSVSFSHGSIAAHAPGVSFLSALRVRAPSSAL